MRRYTEAVQAAMDAKNWYGALALALTFPDVCGALEKPNERGRTRYKQWFRDWVQEKYTTKMGNMTHVFVSGDDCYLLRCSYLHAGSGLLDVKEEMALNQFHFVEPSGGGGYVHKFQSYNKLLLQVDVFCKDMIDGVIAWEAAMGQDQVVKKQRESLLTIRKIGPGFNF